MHSTLFPPRSARGNDEMETGLPGAIDTGDPHSPLETCPLTRSTSGHHEPRETRRDRRRTDLGRAPPAPGVRARSCRDACRYARPRATRARPAGPGSSLPQHVEHALQRASVEARSDTDAAVAAHLNLDGVGKRWRRLLLGLGRDRHRHQRRRRDLGRRAKATAPSEEAKTWLALMSYCRATTETDAPGRDVAATISRFSASGQRLFRRRSALFVSTSDIVGTSSLASIHHERGRFDHWPIRDKAVLTGGRPRGCVLKSE